MLWLDIKHIEGLAGILDYTCTIELDCPQPQMYPPIALNQYKLVNRTHKF